MSQEHYITKRRKFKHISEKHRIQIELMLNLGKTKTEISKIIGISRSTLYEELKRGTVEQLDSQLKPYKKIFCRCWSESICRTSQKQQKSFKNS